MTEYEYLDALRGVVKFSLDAIEKNLDSMDSKIEKTLTIMTGKGIVIGAGLAIERCATAELQDPAKLQALRFTAREYVEGCIREWQEQLDKHSIGDGRIRPKKTRRTVEKVEL